MSPRSSPDDGFRVRSRLENKVVLISGTGGPIGRSAARLFAAHGATVWGCDLDAASAAATVDAVRNDGHDMTSLAPLDLTQHADVERWTTEPVATHGRIDVVYNNAGRNHRLPFEQTTDEQLQFTLDNQFGLAWNVCRAAWPVFARQGHGTIVNTSSVSALTGARTLPYAAHGASNAATLALTRQLAAEGASIGVRANAVVPGIIGREQILQGWRENGVDSRYGALIASTARRMPGTAIDVAYAALYLACDESQFVTGTSLVVDGGSTSLL